MVILVHCRLLEDSKSFDVPSHGFALLKFDARLGSHEIGLVVVGMVSAGSSLFVFIRFAAFGEDKLDCPGCARLWMPFNRKHIDKSIR